MLKSIKPNSLFLNLENLNWISDLTPHYNEKDYQRF